MKGNYRQKGDDFPWSSLLPKSKGLRTQLHDIQTPDRATHLTLRILGDDLIADENLPQEDEVFADEIEEEVDLLLLDGLGEDQD